jgi:outer membrane murein-binding lipoprotein Lpp
MMKTSGLSLSIAVLAFGASTIYLAVQLSEERANSEQLADATRVLNARIAELEKAREAQLPVSGSFGAINMAPAVTMSAPPPPPSVSTEAILKNGPHFPARSEAFQKMMTAQMRAHIRAQNKQTYSDVGTQLGLSREDAGRLVDLLTNQQLDGMGISVESTDPEERVRLMNEARRDDEAKIADLLGPEKLKLLRQYQQTIPARQELDVVAQQIEGSDAAALSDDQRARLLAALVEERNRIPKPDHSRGTAGEDLSKAYVDWQDDYNARIAEQFRGILNTEQYAAYDQYQQWQKEMNAQMRMSAGPNSGAVVYSAVAPGTIVGETAILTTTSETESEDLRKER